MDGRQWLWSIAAASATVFAVAVLAEHRRSKRHDPDRVGWMPWTMVQLVAILVTVFAVALALTMR
ncbi:hypothetical protein [Sphingomonas sp. Leaf4]|uniref:hypothetical protein n=1 Tax=Sphingomonas sp. Leaf4 TaxID=2876553 RepID=UPI001E32D598|nr:hypothetical protein [Sphingomonas sp. Leaf4]